MKKNDFLLHGEEKDPEVVPKKPKHPEIDPRQDPPKVPRRIERPEREIKEIPQRKPPEVPTKD